MEGKIIILYLLFVLYIWSVIAVQISLKEEYKTHPPSSDEDKETDTIWSLIPIFNLSLLIK